MKTLVAFYSRTGNTKRVGKEISKKIKADIDEIIDLKDRKRVIIGWLVSGRDATLKKTTEIKFKKNPLKYDLVIIGTPVWAWTVTPAIRTYLSKNKFKKVAFFCIHGGQFGKTFEEMEKLSKKPIRVFSIKDKEIGNVDYNKKLNKFCEELR